MRILQVTALVAGGVGGHVRMLARGLSDAGHQVLVACPAQVAESFGLAGTGAGVVPVEVGSRARPGRDLTALRELRRAAAGADVVHAHGVRAGALAALALLRMPARAGRRPGRGPGREHGRRPRLVVTTHNDPPGGAAGAVYRALELLVCARADIVLGVSPDLVERARRLGARTTGTAVVPADPTSGTAPTDRAHRRAVRARVRADLGLVEDRTVVLCVGRLGPQKRMAAVVAAAHDLDRDEVSVLVAGDGPQQAELRQQAHAGPADVRLLGHRGDVPDLLLAADVVVSAARWEGQPLWLQEALAAGAAIVATDVGGTALVVGEAAILVPGEDAGLSARLALAVGDLLDRPDRRVELGARALARAERLPTVEDAVAAALTAYRRAG